MSKSLVVLAAAAVLGLVAGCATGQPPGAPVQARASGQTITVADDRVAECRAQGGCVLITHHELLQAAEEAFELGRRQVDCRKSL